MDETRIDRMEERLAELMGLSEDEPLEATDLQTMAVVNQQAGGGY